MEQYNQQTYFPLAVMGEETKDLYFHFTKAKNAESISQTGLHPVIGGYSEGCERTPKVFFSKGHEGILLNADVWMKYFMNKAYGPKNSFGLFSIVYGRDKESIQQGISAWNHEFLSRKFLSDELKKQLLYEKLYQAMQHHVYLALNLEERIDFNPNDIDEVKVAALDNLQTGTGINIAYAEVMYGHKIDSPVMEGWNMHTQSGRGITPEKISQLVTSTGKTDMLSILEQAYAKRDTSKKYEMLDDFMNYVSKRREEDSIRRKSERDKTAEIVMTHGTPSQLQNYKEVILVENKRAEETRMRTQELSAMQDEHHTSSPQIQQTIHQNVAAPQKKLGTHPGTSNNNSSRTSSGGFVNTLPLLLAIAFLSLTGVILYLILQ